ncbi:hypothetical protein Sros01_02930 [Streptomyces roseochromogenus]|nr:hypothetical protein Sros01_02930 [Streptomyces roseochromogenus]
MKIAKDLSTASHAGSWKPSSHGVPVVFTEVVCSDAAVHALTDSAANTSGDNLNAGVQNGVGSL